jgi:hypothetical protein
MFSSTPWALRTLGPIRTADLVVRSNPRYPLRHEGMSP